MTLAANQLESGERIYEEEGCMQSVFPPESFFGFTYFSLMIPPHKPSNMLILGYGNGTISGLTKKVWGEDVPILGIDRKMPEVKWHGDKFLQIDAMEFVDKYAEKQDTFDYIVIDLYNGDRICDFVFEKSFANKISDICSLRFSINLNDKRAFTDNDSFEYENFFKFEISKQVPGNTVIFFKKMEGKLHVA